jgi:hypothetical protein|nr:MAG TPA: hypothetical protein [Caudoviricetes sp.]
MNEAKLDILLEMLLKEHDKGYLRISSVMDRVGAESKDDLLYMLDFINKRFVGAIKNNDDLELWISADRYSEIAMFVNRGGFTREREEEDLRRKEMQKNIRLADDQMRFNETTRKISYISLVITIISLVLAVLSFLESRTLPH